jgi:hypothetical protein
VGEAGLLKYELRCRSSKKEMEGIADTRNRHDVHHTGTIISVKHFSFEKAITPAN